MLDIAGVAAALASGRLTRTRLADETGILLDTETLRISALNETGLFLVESISAGSASLDALVEGLAKAFEVDSEEASADVRAFLGKLSQFLAGEDEIER